MGSQENFSRGSSDQATLLLIGAGHAHLQALMYLCQGFEQAFAASASASIGQPSQSPITILLVEPQNPIWYSGMFPGMLHGLTTGEQSSIGLVDLSAKISRALAPWGISFRWIQDRFLCFGREKVIETIGGQTLEYSAISFNIGVPIAPVPGIEGVPSKPLDELYRQLQEIQNSGEKRQKIDIVGAGASGIELALGIRKFLQDVDPQVRLCGPRGILPGWPWGARKLVQRTCASRGIEIVPEPSQDSRLRILSTGFIREPVFRVDRNLNVQGSQETFAVGDGIQFPGQKMVWGGVFPIRQASFLLRQWVRSAVLPWPDDVVRGRYFRRLLPGVGRTAESTVIDRKPLQILTLGGNEGGLALWKGLFFQGARVVNLKQKIDTQFVNQFVDFDMP